MHCMPAGKAVAYKEDGNEEFKKGRYKEAIAAYTAAMKEKFDDTELAAVLLCNRAAAQYHLGKHTFYTRTIQHVYTRTIQHVYTRTIQHEYMLRNHVYG